jgi:mRNA interferase RelE/StbE
MAYKLIYHPDILKYDLPEIPGNIKETIRRAIEERLLSNPVLFGQPLRQSLKGHRKLRVGNYRVIYRIKGSEIIILKIGHRKEVHRQALSRISWHLNQ